MIEHPIPQNITSYQFRLVGDMTLKQFLELAGGIVLAWFIWSLSLPSFVRWPLIVAAVLLGFALAFIPLEDRPLDQWFIAFFRAIYHPTLFNWKKTAREDIFAFKPKPADRREALEAATKAPAAGIQSLLTAYQMAEKPESQDPLLTEWINKSADLALLFPQVTVPKKLQLGTVFPHRREDSSLGVKETIAAKLESRSAIHPLAPSANPAAVLRGEILLPPKAMVIPENSAVDVDSSVLSLINPQSPAVEVSELPAVSDVPAEHQHLGISPTTAQSLVLPTAPTTSNILSGIVLTPDGQILEGAIVEIRRLSDHLPVRALKTNGLGHFSIATPLDNGRYELEVEKGGSIFDILEIEAKGEIMFPIEIRAKSN